MRKKQKWAYRLEQLYKDQDPDFVIDAIAPLISWLDPSARQRSHRFELRQQIRDDSIAHELVLSWNVAELAKHDERLESDLERMRAGKTLMLESKPEYAAYGLAMVAISCLLQRRVVAISCFCPPDLLLDTTPAALRGVEVAGRSSKGYTALKTALDGSSGKRGKRVQLLERQDVVEAYISLWCREPLVSIWEQVKP